MALCNANLEIKMKNKSYVFFCLFCGFDEMAPPGYDAIEHVLIESGNSLTGGESNPIGGISMGGHRYDICV